MFYYIYMLPPSSENELGIDEVGLGALAGPMVACGVLLPLTIPEETVKKYKLKYIKGGDPIPIENVLDIKDSKKITTVAKRERVAFFIKEIAIRWELVEIAPEIIDRINIYRARLQSYSDLITLFNPDFIRIDGDVMCKTDIPYECVKGGDNKYSHIAAASIIAKDYRDSIMKNLVDDNPEYGWESNKGYGTTAHLQAIKKYGLSEHHRHTFCKNV